MYCQRSDIEDAYGVSNVISWADIDNNGDEERIAIRIDWGINRAYTWMNSQLREGPYDIPFASPYPDDVAYLCALKAGIALYDGRRVVDARDPSDQVSHQREEVKMTIRQILAGQYKLDATKVCKNYPTVVNSSVGADGDAGELNYAESYRTFRYRSREGWA